MEQKKNPAYASWEKNMQVRKVQNNERRKYFTCSDDMEMINGSEKSNQGHYKIHGKDIGPSKNSLRAVLLCYTTQQ